MLGMMDKSYGQFSSQFGNHFIFQVAYNGAWGLTATLPDKEGEQQYHHRKDSILKLFSKDFDPEFRRNLIQYSGDVQCGKHNMIVADLDFRHSDPVTLNIVRRQFSNAWEVWTRFHSEKLPVQLIAIGAGTSWVHDVVEAILLLEAYSSLCRIALISPAPQPDAFMKIHGFVSGHNGCECVMLYHTEDKVSPVWIYDYADFTSAQVGDIWVQNVRLSDSAMMDRAVWGRNKDILLLQNSPQKLLFREWFGGDTNWKRLGEACASFKPGHLSACFTTRRCGCFECLHVNVAQVS